MTACCAVQLPTSTARGEYVDKVCSMLHTIRSLLHAAWKLAKDHGDQHTGRDACFGDASYPVNEGCIEWTACQQRPDTHECGAPTPHQSPTLPAPSHTAPMPTPLMRFLVLSCIPRVAGMFLATAFDSISCGMRPSCTLADVRKLRVPLGCGLLAGGAYPLHWPSSHCEVRSKEVVAAASAAAALAVTMAAGAAAAKATTSKGLVGAGAPDLKTTQPVLSRSASYAGHQAAKGGGGGKKGGKDGSSSGSASTSGGGTIGSSTRRSGGGGSSSGRRGTVGAGSSAGAGGSSGPGRGGGGGGDKKRQKSDTDGGGGRADDDEGGEDEDDEESEEDDDDDDDDDAADVQALKASVKVLQEKHKRLKAATAKADRAHVAAEKVFKGSLPFEQRASASLHLRACAAEHTSCSGALRTVSQQITSAETRIVRLQRSPEAVAQAAADAKAATHRRREEVRAVRIEKNLARKKELADDLAKAKAQPEVQQKPNPNYNEDLHFGQRLPNEGVRGGVRCRVEKMVAHPNKPKRQVTPRAAQMALWHEWVSTFTHIQSLPYCHRHLLSPPSLAAPTGLTGACRGFADANRVVRECKRETGSLD